MNRRGWIDEIPTIMISVETGGSYIDRAFQLGAADYVSRPFVPNMIRRRVINAILLHTKTRKLTGLIADHFYPRQRNTSIPPAGGGPPTFLPPFSATRWRHAAAREART